ncbi:hypothetical protein RSO68_08250 [Halomonas saccharevitans]|uniref:Uncharacterized protein n=1 Tax=Halomonas saccharevitans TaxID=416872 RepID=A0ABU3NGR3_9GAMM|nr:hypothetical protein [Halomonas saccharevitans]MDT8879457.1 hypothetical protein [Halomonas saccharevitans]
MTTPIVHDVLTPRRLLLGLLLVAPLTLASEGYDLTFQGDASFAGAHGGQAVQAALVDADSGEVLEMASGTVSADDDPTFSFDFPGALSEGGSYAVHYWIDSNFGGGSEGSCDPMGTDHQWSVALEASGGAVTHVESHDPGAQSEVCATFE